MAAMTLTTATTTQPAIAAAGMLRRSPTCTISQPQMPPPTKPPRWPPIEMPLTLSENTMLISRVMPRPFCQIEIPR